MRMRQRWGHRTPIRTRTNAVTIGRSLRQRRPKSRSKGVPDPSQAKVANPKADERKTESRKDRDRFGVGSVQRSLFTSTFVFTQLLWCWDKVTLSYLYC